MNIKRILADQFYQLSNTMGREPKIPKFEIEGQEDMYLLMARVRVDLKFTPWAISQFRREKAPLIEQYNGIPGYLILDQDVKFEMPVEEVTNKSYIEIEFGLFDTRGTVIYQVPVREDISNIKHITFEEGSIKISLK